MKRRRIIMLSGTVILVALVAIGLWLYRQSRLDPWAVPVAAGVRLPIAVNARFLDDSGQPVGPAAGVLVRLVGPDLSPQAGFTGSDGSPTQVLEGTVGRRYSLTASLGESITSIPITVVAFGPANRTNAVVFIYVWTTDGHIDIAILDKPTPGRVFVTPSG